MSDNEDRVMASVERERLKREYSDLFEDLSALLFSLDPMGLNYEINPDEYEPEVGTILPRLLDTDEESDVAQILREEFDRWFGRTTLQNATYDDLAEQIELVLQRYRDDRT